jgi:hypothetical protein
LYKHVSNDADSVSAASTAYTEKETDTGGCACYGVYVIAQVNIKWFMTSSGRCDYIAALLFTSQCESTNRKSSIANQSPHLPALSIYYFRSPLYTAAVAAATALAVPTVAPVAALPVPVATVATVATSSSSSSNSSSTSKA